MRLRSRSPSQERKRRDVTPRPNPTDLDSSVSTSTPKETSPSEITPSKVRIALPKRETKINNQEPSIVSPNSGSSDEVEDSQEENSKKELDTEDDRGRARIKPRIASSDIPSSDMISLMGFTAFGSTKNKKVNPKRSGDYSANESTNYRQYINRSKNNRPLDKD